MFIAFLFIIARNWKYLASNRWIEKENVVDLIKEVLLSS